MEMKDYQPVRVDTEPFNGESTDDSSIWDDVDHKDQDIKKRSEGPWAQPFQLAKEQTVTTAQKIPAFMKNDVWPWMKKDLWSWLKKIRCSKKQVGGFSLLLFFGIAPFLGVFGPYFASSAYGSRRSPFSDKTMSCGNGWGETQNSTVRGIEGLFTLDLVFGHMTFAQAKVLDVSWDLLVGKGVQLWAWFISYIVFTAALLRVIERHPAPYRTFLHLSLEGPSIASMWALLKDLARYRSRRTVALFLFLALCISYVLSLPVVLGAMTGYVSTSIAYVSLPDSANQIVSADEFADTMVSQGDTSVGLKDNSCVDMNAYDQWSSLLYNQREKCNCSLPNGTLTMYDNILHSYDDYSTPYYITQNLLKSCAYNYTNNTQTFQWDQDYYSQNAQPDRKTYNCNTTFNLTVNGHGYPLTMQTFNYTSGYCYNGTGYNYTYLEEHSRCMPDTDHPTYQWGFSTMLSAVFVIVHLLWSIGMYAVWQDAQFNSRLVQQGYKMNNLRAVFTLARAAQGRTGMETEELMRADTKELEKELFGKRKKGKKPDAEISYDMFHTELPYSKGEASGSEQTLR